MAQCATSGEPRFEFYDAHGKWLDARRRMTPRVEVERPPKKEKLVFEEIDGKFVQEHMHWFDSRMRLKPEYRHHFV